MKNKAPSIIHFIDRFRNAIILASIFVGSVTTYYGATQVIKTAPRASGTGSVCSASGCPEGQHCTTGSQWCEVYTGCVSGKAQLKVYFCDATSGAAAAKWVYKGTQDGKNACSFPQCSSSTISITPASCPCQGGAYTIGFKTNRKLNSGENISCTVSSSGTCACAGGKACDNSRKDGSCNISSGSDSCSVPNLDCSCKPYNYNCTGTASKQGSFAQAKNGGGDTVNLTLSTPTTAPQPTTPPAQPINTPAPQPTTPPGQPTNTPVPNQPTPTRAPTPTPQPGVTVTATPTPTLVPGTTATPTPTSPVVYVQPTPATYIPQSGISFEKGAWWSIGLVGLGILGVLIF